jgi:hypothetical protein
VNVETGEEVAIKLENLRTKYPQLHHECRIYRILKGGGFIFPLPCPELFLFRRNSFSHLVRCGRRF